MQIIPIAAVPNQIVQATLGGQSVIISIYQKFYGLFADVQVDNVPILSGVLCLNLNKIVRSAYLGFIGDLMFIDNTGQGNDPVYTGLGAQFSLAYLEASDLSAN